MINLSQLFLSELEMEAPITKRILERIPVESSAWQPHEKSFAMGDLAKHVAEIPGWMELMISANELDFGTMNYTPPVVENSADLIKLFEKNIAVAKEQLGKADESKYTDLWTMRHGAQIFFTMPRHQVIRRWIFNHVVHHRSQLGVYLRLLDIPVPGIYGPSADDNGS